jgi:bifunctional ADP-heptose synthase (sugar kinase/adenylyltransferase)
MQSHTQKKKIVVDANMPVIECFCGAKILMTPNVKEMGQAIEAHAEEHAKNYKTKKEKDEASEKVRDYLISGLLSKVSEA